MSHYDNPPFSKTMTYVVTLVGGQERRISSDSPVEHKEGALRFVQKGKETIVAAGQWQMIVQE